MRRRRLLLIALAALAVVAPVAIGGTGAYFTGSATSATQTGTAAGLDAPGVTLQKAGATTGQSTTVSWTAPASRPWEAQGVTSPTYTVKRNTVPDFSVSSGATQIYQDTGSTTSDSVGSAPVSISASGVWALQRMDGSIALINGKPYRWGLAFRVDNSSGTPTDNRGSVWGGATGQADFNTGVLTEMKFSGTSEELLDIAPGRDHACALSVTHKVYCIGFGSQFGQSGNATGSTDATATSPVTWTPITDPRGVFTGKSIVQVTSGEYFSCALAGDGTIGCWGWNAYSQLGSADNTGASYGAPVRVAKAGGGDWDAFATNKPIMIAAGADHVCAVRGPNVDGVAPTKAVACWGATAGNRLGAYTTGTKSAQPRDIDDPNSVLTGIKKITAGTGATCVINDKTGTNVACWGVGVLTGRMTAASATQDADSAVPAPINTTLTGFSSIDLSNAHGCAGAGTSIVCWGQNSFQKLGTNDASADQSKFFPPRAVVDANSVFRGENIISVATGWSHSCAASVSGTVACWGYNALGQLGQDTSTTASGGTSSSQTYQPTTIKLANAPLLPQRADFLGSSYGSGNMMLASINGKHYVWGQGAPAGTTVSWPSPTRLGETVVVKKSSMGAAFACLISVDNRIFCWGDNGSGQRGYSGGSSTTLNEIADPNGVFTGKTLVDIATTELSTCVLASDGTIGCWGAGSSGELAGRATSSAVPLRIGTGADGATPFPDLSGTATPLGIVGGSRTFCTNSAAGITCWGGNGTGGYLLGLASNASASTSSSVPTLTSGSATTFAQGVIALDLSSATACAVAKSDGFLYCWGGGANGLLGTASNAASTPTPTKIGTIAFMGVAVAAMHGCALPADGGFPQCWGNNNVGQLGRATTSGMSSIYPVTDGYGTLANSTPTSVRAMNSTTCITTDNGKILCWGEGASGQTGVGDSTIRMVPAAVKVGGTEVGIVTTCLDGAVKVGTGCSLVPTRTYYYQVTYSIPGAVNWVSDPGLATR